MLVESCNKEMSTCKLYIHTYADSLFILLDFVYKFLCDDGGE